MAPHLSLMDDGSSTTIVGLVQALRERQATVPADKAFALRGVLDRLKFSTSTHGYTKSYGQVYHNFFLDLLRYDTRLVNLLVDVGPKLPGVPSWVPDWNSLQERNWLDARFVHDHADLYGASFPAPQMKIAEDTLGMWSIGKGSVAFCSALFQKAKYEAAALDGLDDVAFLNQKVGVFAAWVRAISDVASAQISHDQEDSLQDMYNVLMGRPTVPSDSELDTFKRWLHTLQTRSINIPDVGPIRSAEDIFAGDAKALESTTKCYNQLTGKRLLFITQGGKLGSGPCGKAVGDRVTLLRGVAVPMIIRCTSEEMNTFEVVGPAFVSPVIDVARFNKADFGHDWEPVHLV
ncbi:hypothetical protein PG997_000299 [Apiospora hydei]|uniref:Uncharacterized protein n=1 Tax=Apiospora hydei TaxID=1337664 RepID=A0ABR1XAH0_9PEZI